MTRAIHAGRGPFGDVDPLSSATHLQVTGVRLSAYPDLVAALTCVKQAAALANRDLGRITDREAAAIAVACEEIRAGRWHDQFAIDMLSDATGTAANLNTTEIIAERALKLLDCPRRDLRYKVNLNQDTDHVYSTAVRLALHSLTQQLHNALTVLQQAITAKANESAATMPALGQELAGYQTMLTNDQQRLADTRSPIHAVHAEAGSGYPGRFHRHLAELTKVWPSAGVVPADIESFVQLSGALKAIAVTVSTVCTGLAELSASPLITGVVNQITCAVIGHDVTVGIAAQAGRACQPVIAHSLFQSLTTLRAGCRLLGERGLREVQVNRIPLPRQRPGDTRDGGGEFDIDKLSRRELQIAELVSEGRTNRWIASALSLSIRTVETYVRRTFAKLSASSRSEVAAIVVRSAESANRSQRPYTR